ncbi:MAG: type II toxin-antitoxin system VapC family toxin [Nitrospira sp.]|nr:type II toxin-antitoxin system VapC family toxin [Nitrospira sp.]MDE0404960.1 type II toxin-antitoxin system VapC family toxin [Nitrospira sp.]MDE0487317.1 type II toxin-antitoxin system VapC family toxin [Nitrospira sp.]
MVVDTSALIAIMQNEPERRRFNELIEAATATYVSAATLLETRMVLFARSGDSAVLALDAFLLKSGMIVMEVSPHIADIAFDAYRRYGKVSGRRAVLNYGDCFSYALAKHLAAPLLFKGSDFSKTDIRSAANERTERHRPADP